MASPSTAVAPPPLPGLAGPRQRPRLLQFASFVAAISWYLCSRLLAQSASNGLALRFNLGDYQPLLEAVSLLFLLVCGLALLRGIEQRRAPLRLTLGFPRRVTSRTEWATGAAIGWGLAVACVLPMALARTLDVQLWTSPRAFYLLGVSLFTLAILTLAHTVAVYGYGFQRLIDATGPVRATLILVAAAAVVHAAMPVPYGTPQGPRILVDMLTTVLFCLCWHRTHGLWLLWGLHFAWAASAGVLFGLPLGGDISFSSVVDTRAVGPVWLTGGAFGPNAAALTILFLLAAIPLLVRVTDDYAWNYTHPPIIPGGYDVSIPPPAAHVAMEEASQPVNPASLVQILPAAPQAPPADSPSE